jgi:hypothetical protein
MEETKMVLDQTGFFILLAANIPLYFILGWWLFRTWSGFWECLRFWITPDIVSMVKGEFSDDFWAEMKIFWWIILCGACIYGELRLI